MKRHSSQLGIWLLAATALITGCNKKKQPTVAPQAKAPTVSSPQPATQPATITQPPATTAPANQTATTTPSATKPKAKPKTKHNHAKKTAPATNPPASKEANATPAPAVLAAPMTTATPAPNTPDKPEKTVVHDGGTSEPPGAILPGIDQNEANRQREATEKLLLSTDDALKGINRTLTVDEQAMVAQIRNYMTQSRAATTDGDLLRANNLAVKAHLLTDELIKR